MKKYFLVASLVLALMFPATQVSAQNATKPTPVSVTASIVQVVTLSAGTTQSIGPAMGLSGSGIAFHKIIWFGQATLTTCAVRVNGSSDGVTYSNGSVIAAQTCTSNGSFLSTETEVNFAKVELSTVTGGGNLTVVYLGYQVNPAITVTVTGTSDINLKQVNGATVNVGAGASGTGTQRVAVASDSGDASIDVTNTVAQVIPKFVVGTTYANSVYNPTTQVATANIKSGSCQVLGGFVTNINAALRYIQFYNSTSSTAGTPAYVIPLPAGSATNPGSVTLDTVFMGAGINLATGCTIGISTTLATYSGATSTDHVIWINYK